jgi:hypothetical protein
LIHSGRRRGVVPVISGFMRSRVGVTGMGSFTNKK